MDKEMTLPCTEVKDRPVTRAILVLGFGLDQIRQNPKGHRRPDLSSEPTKRHQPFSLQLDLTHPHPPPPVTATILQPHPPLSCSGLNLAQVLDGL
jgi:hypothetical protein